ncbi:tyrosine--tRNA ligase [bacterium]|nr:tyrosine--tRNA ligase [bacterium]
MKINSSLQKIKELLERGVEEIIEKENLLKKLKSGKRLRIKHGIDPTGPKIHIGRASQLWKLKAFQELGHKIVLIIGDFTAQIGDASDKTSMRKPLTKKEIQENLKTYRKQIGKILDLKKVEIHRNSEWLERLKLKDILGLCMKFTAQQMIQRRNFKQRWEGGKPIGIHELFYPILQGYDSVQVQADVEIGGFDQLFNLKVGRDIQKMFNQKPQDIMTLKMIHGLDGRKMSTSWGNVINIVDEPNEMYGKIMSMKDELIGEYFELCTKIPLKEVDKIKRSLKQKKLNPRDAKATLAKEIVKLYHGERAAQKAEREFEKVFRKKKLPSKIPVFRTSKKILNILDLIFQTGLASSKSQAKRLVLEKGVKIDGKLKTDWQEKIKIRNNMIVQVGKRKFIKIKVKK